MRFASLPASLTGEPGKISVLGFGCSALLGRSGRSESLAALAAATDAGLNFFDTARSYGYGESEALLGEFLAGRRHEAVICTKFGIVPAARGGWKQRIKPLAQAVVRMVPALRGMARKAAAGDLAAGQFSTDVLQSSLEQSLRALKTDYVDMLLLHGATLPVLQQDDLLEALARLVAQGKVRMAGISGEHEVMRATFAQRPPALTTAQFAMDPAHLSFAEETAQVQKASTGMLLVANHPFGGVTGVAETVARIDALRALPELPSGLREKLVAGDRQVMPEMVLNAILSGTGIAAVVPAMMKVANLKSNVAAVESCRFSATELQWLRGQLAGR